ncbi:hypothetical protein P280DRAFT_472625 [Massarina eburnea CBS 473.64]|uniref:Nucleolar protein NOP52 variant n=1 Tax=Massarina eburnea CBS 473.64 TaxID=1395130 RepID=A0A6A6RNK5_9PLEO|nr:hypothetical protein P280DRAFT_472625 [Massarina eburnea CBS 473.64]
MATDAQNSPFIKHLASSDKKTRDQALTSLRAFLSAQTEISELDLLKLWKGLFYCLWMQDKPKLQNRLSSDLASLPATLRPVVVLPFLRAFFLTIAREWINIEALRLDKYLFLIRQYVNASFKYLAREKWNEDMVKQWNGIMEEIPLNATETKLPNGLRYHVLDIWVDELEKVEEGWAKEEMREALGRVMEPVEKLAKDGRLKVVRTAAKECLADERLQAWRGEAQDEVDEEMSDEKDEEWGGFDD